MSSEILDRLKIDSTINIPDSLQDLFRALDFSTRFGQHEIPLIMRGDGIQSRHLPFILNYISAKSSQYHIWGYEEPENSLELSKAFEMAKDFQERFSQENQIFLTTHSPAFYDISGRRAAKWYIESMHDGERVSSQIQSIASTSNVDKAMGLLSVITPRMKKVYSDYVELKESITEMQSRVDSAECPVIYVEGPSDVTILNTAKEKLGFQEMNVRFESANGASDITQFLKISIRVKRDNRPLIGIFDSDARGRREFDNFRNYHKLTDTEFRTLERSRKIFVGALDVPTHLKPAEAAFRSVGLTLPLPVEFMFEQSVILSAVQSGTLNLIERKAKIANEEFPLEVTIDSVLKGKLDDSYLYLAKAISDDCKTNFATWISDRPANDFEPFREILRQISVAIT
ncbi:AAA family ATPase [Alteraurantiacibacter lauratis]